LKISVKDYENQAQKTSERNFKLIDTIKSGRHVGDEEYIFNNYKQHPLVENEKGDSLHRSVVHN
jgi:hypothetical protein